MVNILQYQSWGIINEIYPNIFSYYFFVEQLFFEFNTEQSNGIKKCELGLRIFTNY